MLFVAAGVTDTKVRHSTGVATTNSTNKNPNANKLSWAINYTVLYNVEYLSVRSVLISNVIFFRYNLLVYGAKEY